MEEQIKALKAFLKEQNLSRFAKETKVKRAVIYDFLSGKNIRMDHFIKILQGTGFKIQDPEWSRFHLEEVPFDQSQKLNLLRLLDLIVEKYDPEKIILFGSQATGKWGRRSDFDFALIDVHNKQARGDLLHWASESGLKMIFDYFVMTSEQLRLEAKSEHSMENAVIREGTVLYERHKSDSKSKGRY